VQLHLASLGVEQEVGFYAVYYGIGLRSQEAREQLAQLSLASRFFLTSSLSFPEEAREEISSSNPTLLTWKENSQINFTAVA
jgi:hypothetical protein